MNFKRYVCPYLNSSGNSRLRESMRIEIISHGIQPEDKSESRFKFEVDCPKWLYEICQLLTFSACILATWCLTGLLVCLVWGLFGKVISLQARKAEQQEWKSRKEWHQQRHTVRGSEEQKPMFRHSSEAMLEQQECKREGEGIGR